MTRALLIVFAALAAGIAYLVGVPWLYAVAGVLLLASIGLLVRDWRRERRQQERRSARAEAAVDADEELRSLGIVEVRPKQKQATPVEGPAPAEAASVPAGEEPDAETDEEPPVPAEDFRPEERPASEDRDDTSASPSAIPVPKAKDVAEEDVAEEDLAEEDLEEEDAAEEHPAEEAPRRAWTEAEAEKIGALVRAARLSADAPVAMLLAQQEEKSYRIEALDAAEDGPPLHASGTSFSTDAPLLPDGAARHSVAHLPVGGAEAPPRLGYYRHPAEIDAARRPSKVLVVPVQQARRGAPPPCFLLVEAPAGEPPAGRDALLEDFARLLEQAMGSSSGTAESGEALAIDSASPEPPQNSTVLPHVGSRPRGEIVAEEMDRARREERPLSLALVYLNRAEAVAERGMEEVQVAERALRARLRQAAPDGRVEPFGELTYGVFYSGSRAETEAWAVALQDEMAAADDPLEGGISVGLALMRGPEQDPAALRANATNALREAYTTGTCTILE